ncbi:hypothetical protein [Streptomyces niveus]|uniref:hypothetical protein n=1 Tax=Streptomyces niveus TaxID=193462 RepID=UPI0034267D32
MNLEQASEFLNSYLDAEYAEGLASRTEPDEVLGERRRVSESFLYSTPDSPMFSVIGRRPGYSADELEEYAQSVDQVARRVLFLVAEHEHPEWGRLFVGYVSGSSPRITGAYEFKLFVKEIEGEPKVTAQYASEILKPAPPVQWVHVQGARIDDLGGLVAVKALSEPTFKAHRLDWAATRDSAH